MELLIQDHWLEQLVHHKTIGLAQEETYKDQE